MANLDIYHHWLGIPPDQQPPTLYRLLGLVEFESDVNVIRSAAERQSMHVRRLARGDFVSAGQELLNEIARAKLQLIDDVKRAAYDRTLVRTGAVKPHPENPQTEHAGPQQVRAQQEKVQKRITASFRGSNINATVLSSDLQSSNTQGPWVLGYRPECDARIDHDTVSGMHCKVSHERSGCSIIDLKSTNGTFVNGVRVSRAALVPSDLLVLGGDHRVILPANWFGSVPSSPVVAFLGRHDGNEFVVDSPGVSPFHARLILNGDSLIVDDLQSVNGTTLHRKGQVPVRISRSLVGRSDVIQFYDVEVEATAIIDSLRRWAKR